MQKYLRFILYLIFTFQKVLLVSAFYYFKFFIKREKGLWIIGVDETAATINKLSYIFGKCETVSLSNNRYYNYKHSFSINIKNKYLCYAIRVFYGPLLLAYLLNKADGFIYIWHSGFLIDHCDGRSFEFSFIKKNKKALVCIFVGSDIRSLKLSLEIGRKLNMDVMATYQSINYSYAKIELIEKDKMLIARSADQYADLIYNFPTEQKCYIKKSTNPFFYLFSDDMISKNDTKFENINLIKIVHAPSSPIIKGTPIVRAAIKKLQLEGYNFDYIELIGVENEKVLNTLKSAHIVLNEFYAFVPGLFGIEAMASHCALVTSGDAEIESELPIETNSAWMKTHYWEVYDNLKTLLDNPHLIKMYADAGINWTLKYCSYSNARANIVPIIEGLIND